MDWKKIYEDKYPGNPAAVKNALIRDAESMLEAARSVCTIVPKKDMAPDDLLDLAADLDRLRVAKDLGNDLNAIVETAAGWMHLSSVGILNNWTVAQNLLTVGADVFPNDYDDINERSVLDILIRLPVDRFMFVFKNSSLKDCTTEQFLVLVRCLRAKNREDTITELRGFVSGTRLDVLLRT